MATTQHATVVREKFGYSFGVLDWLKLALTAAGAEASNHDGNRGLAEIGNKVMELAIAERNLEGAEPKDRLHGLSELLKSKERRASAARIAGIDCHIKLCERSRGSPSTGVLSLAMSALVGAVWKDSSSLITVWHVLNRVGELCSTEAAVPVVALAQPDNPGSVPGSGEGDDETTAHENATSAAILPVIEAVELEDLVPVFSANDIAHSASNPGYDAVLIDDPYESIALEMFGGSATSWNNSIEPTMDIVPGDDSDDFPFLDRLTSTSPSVMESGVTVSLTAEADSVSQHSSAAQSLPPRSANLDSRLSSDAPLVPPNLDKRSEAIRHILDGICSPGSLLALAEMVRVCKHQENFAPPSPLGGLTALDRLSAIDEIENHSAHMTLIRRAHILQLYLEYPDSTRQEDNFVTVNFQQNVNANRVRKAGNPLNGSKSDATRLLMSHAYPGLQPDSPRYKSKYRKLKQLRKLGQRLHELTALFGEGVIGLLQNLDNGQGSCQTLNITDSMLLGPTDTAFEQGINMMDRCQVKLLRDFSAAVAPVVRALVSQTLKDTDNLPLERLGEEDIMGHPRFSPALLELITT